MTRYREAHDIWHVLLSLPPTVLGELGLKWFEFFQTGLPSTALSAVGGPFAAQLSNSDRVELFRTYVPWARRAANRAVFLMNVYFEQMWEEDIEEVRKKLRIERFAYQGEVMSAHEPH
jgi:ubiquinone biosynthesis protein COQ4